jgi:hypothetical protein
MCRYRTGDVVRVDGFMLFDMRTSMVAQPGAQEEPGQVQRLPVVSFKGRAGCVLNLVWWVPDTHALSCVLLLLVSVPFASPGCNYYVNTLAPVFVFSTLHTQCPLVSLPWCLCSLSVTVGTTLPLHACLCCT